MTIHIPTPLRAYTGGLESVPVDAGTVTTALEQLVTTYPALRGNLFGADEDDIRYLPMKEESPTTPQDELTIIPSIAGGR
jgi:adenylyltransferase/sulfurtransferase